MVGTTLNTAVLPSWFTVAGLTEATPEVAATSLVIWFSSDWLSEEDCFGSSTTTASGPLAPGPKPWEIRSKAWRLLSDVGFVPLSGCPSVIENNGMARMIRTATLATAHGHGRSLTLRPQRANALCSCCSWVAAALRAACSCAEIPALRARNRADSDRTLLPATPMNAGTRVSAASIVTATTIAAARPSAPTNATPDTYRPRIDTTTVPPATTMAAPEVPSARAAEVIRSIPVSICSRCLAIRNSP